MNKELKFTIPAQGSQEFTYPTGVDQIAITNNDGVDGDVTIITREITKTKSGDIVSFDDGADAPFADLKVNIEAVQSGSGDPSPTNVRPITGWTGANVYVSDEDTSSPTTYNINWQSIAGTVYGGTLDVTSGMLTVDKAIVDLGTLNWTYSVERTYPYFTHSGTLPNGRIGGSGISNIKTVQCEIYKTLINMGGASFGNNNYNYCVCQNSGVSFAKLLIQDTRFNDATAFGTAMNGVKLVYEIATPIEYNLTPQQINSLLGINNIWADCGPVDVRYFVQSTQPLIDYIDEKTENVVEVFKATDNGGGVYTLDDITCDELCLYARNHSNIVLKVARYNSSIAYDIFILSDYIGTSAVFRHTMITSAVGGGSVLYVRELQADSGTTTNVLTTRGVNITADT